MKRALPVLRQGLTYLTKKIFPSISFEKGCVIITILICLWLYIMTINAGSSETEKSLLSRVETFCNDVDTSMMSCEKCPVFVEKRPVRQKKVICENYEEYKTMTGNKDIKYNYLSVIFTQHLSRGK